MLRQTVSALDEGDRAGFDDGDVFDLRPRLTDLKPSREVQLGPRVFPLLPGGVWFSGPGCYRLVNEGPGFRHTIDFPVGLVD